jgi:hypothetical protein
MRVTFCLVSCLVLFLVFGSTGAARESKKHDGPANKATRLIYKEAVRILNGIEQTKYIHVTQMDEEKGIYLCDCSGFCGYVLSRTVSKENPKDLLGDGKGRPRARDFELTFAAAPTKPDRESRWQRIERVLDARPGDILAWRHEVDRPNNSGHVVIIAEKPVVEESGLVRVVMIDSTTKPQVDDTRPAGTSGIGKGTMWLKVDEHGRAIAHVRGSRDAKPQEEAISIGRALPVRKDAAKRRAA